MGQFAIIRPRDDAAAQQASDWAIKVRDSLLKSGHVLSVDVDDTSPANTTQITTALTSLASVILYFGHGNNANWLTNGGSTITGTQMSVAKGKAVISIACRTSHQLGPDAITAGVMTWLGFSIKVAVITPHVWVDPIGEAIIDGLTVLGNGSTMQAARDEIAKRLNRVMIDYDLGGRYDSHPAAGVGYYAAMAMRDHVSVQGTPSFCPLP